jgi:hypothetical protein
MPSHPVSKARRKDRLEGSGALPGGEIGIALEAMTDVRLLNTVQESLGAAPAMRQEQVARLPIVDARVNQSHNQVRMQRSKSRGPACGPRGAVSSVENDDVRFRLTNGSLRLIMARRNGHLDPAFPRSRNDLVRITVILADEEYPNGAQRPDLSCHCA